MKNPRKGARGGGTRARGTRPSPSKEPTAQTRQTAPPRKPAQSRARRTTPRPPRAAAGAVPVTAAELRVLQQELERRLGARPAPGSRTGKRTGGGDSPGPMRWNPDPEDLQKSVAQLVLTIVEFLRQLMERQAIRRMEANTLTEAEVEAVGQALMRLEETVRDIGARFGLTPEELNLDLGPVKLI